MKCDPRVLVAHPAVPPAEAWRIEVCVTHGADGLGLSFRLFGDLDSLRIPPSRPAGPADGLWRHTCFEAFVGAAGRADYREFNFSPSGRWAAYAFRDYRERDEGVAMPAGPSLRAVHETGVLGMDVALPAAILPSAAPGAALQLGLAAVAEAADGSLSWWALHHPAARPDFHDRAGFVLRLDAPPPKELKGQP